MSQPVVPHYFNVFLVMALAGASIAIAAVFVSIDPKLGNLIPVLFGIAWGLVIVAVVYAYCFLRKASSK